MINSKLLKIVFIAVLCFSVSAEDILAIDEFITESPALIIALAQSAPPSIVQSNFVSGNGILGQERDMILSVKTGSSGLVFTASVISRTLQVSTPNGGTSELTVQYDGIDGSAQLNTNPGLNGVNLLTSNGKTAAGFRLDVRSDISTSLLITAVDSSGNSASATADIPAGVSGTSIFVAYSQFVGVSFSSVNAISLSVVGEQNADVLVESFNTADSNTISPTRSPTRSFSRNNSKTPTPTNSPTRNNHPDTSTSSSGSSSSRLSSLLSSLLSSRDSSSSNGHSSSSDSTILHALLLLTSAVLLLLC